MKWGKILDKKYFNWFKNLKFNKISVTNTEY